MAWAESRSQDAGCGFLAQTLNQTAPRIAQQKPYSPQKKLRLAMNTSATKLSTTQTEAIRCTSLICVVTAGISSACVALLFLTQNTTSHEMAAIIMLAATSPYLLTSKLLQRMREGYAAAILAITTVTICLLRLLLLTSFTAVVAPSPAHPEGSCNMIGLVLALDFCVFQAQFMMICLFAAIHFFRRWWRPQDNGLYKSIA